MKAATPFRCVSGLIAATVLATTAQAQTPSYSEFHDRALAALGGEVTTLAYSGNGWDACLGQAWDVNEGWARWELTDYRRVIDYAARTSTQSAMRRAGLDPDRIGGCGAQPGASASPQQSSIRAGANFADQLPIWLTPHGFLAMASAGEAEIAGSGDNLTVSTEVQRDSITYRVFGEFGSDYLPRRIGTWIDDPIFGDMAVTAEFSGWRDFGDVVFPSQLTLTQGGLATLSLTLDAVESGVASPDIGPARAFGGGGAVAAAETVEIGDGIYVMPGAYQGVAVEFDDFVVVIDGMQNDARTAEIIDLAHQAVPGKPIRYVVNTHSHFDHATGLRQYAAEGATILTHERNTEFFRDALSTPRTLNPDPTEPASVGVTVEGMSERRLISDASGQALEIIPLAPSPHAADMLIAYLPDIATVVEADILQPWINPVFAGDGEGPHPMLAYLDAEIDRLGIDVQSFVPVHTPPEPPLMPRSALDEAVGKTSGISTGHMHLTVPDIERHRQIWTSLGGVPKTSGSLQLIEFPGIFVLLTEAEPSSASTATTANHFGFSVRDYDDYRARLEAVGASFFYESAENGQILADLPDGVRIEILTDETQQEPIVFHHMHLSATDAEGLRQWYLDVFGAEAGERRGLPSAIVPGGRVDFIPAQEAPAGSRGAAIDHIGFETDDMDAFAARMRELGIAFDRGPMRIDAIGLSIAFITDPAGTYIEITEGLADID